MTTEALAIATSAWDAWMAGDIDGFLATLADDAVMTLPGTAPTSGTFHGPAEVGTWAQRLFELSGGTIDGRVETFGDAGDGIVLTSMSARATRGDGKVLDQRILQRFEIDGGKIRRLDHALMDIEGWHEFWSG